VLVVELNTDDMDDYKFHPMHQVISSQLSVVLEDWVQAEFRV
jgi:hypothetical protein